MAAVLLALSTKVGKVTSGSLTEISGLGKGLPESLPKTTLVTEVLNAGEWLHPSQHAGCAVSAYEVRKFLMEQGMLKEFPGIPELKFFRENEVCSLSANHILGLVFGWRDTVSHDGEECVPVAVPGSSKVFLFLLPLCTEIDPHIVSHRVTAISFAEPFKK